MASKLIRLTILTGSTGCGKTTFLCQYSLDFCMKGVPTLWCSFELKNEVVLASMLKQMSGEELSDSSESFDYWADQFERLPMYFQTFFGSTDVKKVLNLIDYSIYAYNVTHIVLDNMQFMLSGQGRGFERFELQDDLISQLRTIATERNVHITLVIHPKKTDDGQDLNIASIFGTSKATQEADNIMIIQNRSQFKLLDIKKNRYDGETGRVALLFDKDSKRFENINNVEVEKLLGGGDPKEILKSRHGRRIIVKKLAEEPAQDANGVKLKTAEEALVSGQGMTGGVRTTASGSLMQEIERQIASKELTRITGKAKEDVFMEGDVKHLVDKPLTAGKQTPQTAPFEQPTPLPNAQLTVPVFEAPPTAKNTDSIQNHIQDQTFLKDQVDSPKDNLTIFDQHFKDLENMVSVGLSANTDERRKITGGKWDIDSEDSINFFGDKGPIMTYDDLMNQYTSNASLNKRPPYPSKKSKQAVYEDLLMEEMLKNE